MRYYCVKTFAVLLSVLVFWGCPSSSIKEEKGIARKPEIVLRIASLNLGNFKKRIIQKNIVQLVKVLKREQVEVLAVQGITRYPGVASRVDFLNELTTKTEWRNAFGEMENISGRQTGNAIFSSYPILSKHNQSFDHLKTTGFEAALLATIDAGVRPLTVVSVQMPSKITPEEELHCLKLITASNPDVDNETTVMTGNLSSSEKVRTSSSMAEIPLSKSVRNTTPSVWYSTSESVQFIASRTVETELGRLLITQFGIFREK